MRHIVRVLAISALAIGAAVPAGSASAAPGAEVRREFFLMSPTPTCFFDRATQVYTTWILVTREDDDGGYIQHIQVHGTGTGSPSVGIEYVLNEQRTFRTTGFDYTEEVRTVLVSKGSAPNERIVMTFDSATGEMTVSTECTGAGTGTG